MYEIYAINTGNWGPDELYGQEDRPRFKTRAEAEAERARLAQICGQPGSPDGLAYGIDDSPE